jgi:hypothetical protein
MPFLVAGVEKARSPRSWLVFSVALEAQEAIPINPTNAIKARKLIIGVRYTE